jgi:hypothetical protein
VIVVKIVFRSHQDYLTFISDQLRKEYDTPGIHVGKFLCDCRKTGNWKCDCKRQFADLDADWGWDSYRERYYYGRTLYMFCAADSPYN